jgi:transposase InsO family protein
LKRLNLRLQPYNFKIHYKPGVNNPADYASRHPSNSSTHDCDKLQRLAEEHVNLTTVDATPRAMSLDEIKDETAQDLQMQKLMEIIHSNRWTQSRHDPDIAPFYAIRNELTVNERYKIILRENRIIIPVKLQRRAVQLAHSGHQGIVKTKQLLREKVWFPNVDSLVETIVSRCIACQANTNPAKKNLPVQSTPLPKAKWLDLSADFCGPFPTGEYLLVVIDDYSRYPVAEIIHSTSTDTVTSALEKIFSLFGTPETLKTDNGPPFNGAAFRTFALENGFHHRKITPLWPRANGEAERFMRTLEKTIRAAKVESKDWKRELFKFLHQYRATPHSTTGMAPGTVMFNRSMHTTLPEIEVQRDDHELRDYDVKRKAAMKRNADERSHAQPEHDIKVGDYVLVRMKPVNKLSPTYSAEPYKVIAVKGSMITAELQNHRLTRNASFFKRLNIDDYQEPVEPSSDIDDYDDELPITSQHTEPAKPPSQQPTSDQRLSQSERSTSPRQRHRPASDTPSTDSTTDVQDQPLLRRSQRQSKIPIRYADYATK